MSSNNKCVDCEEMGDWVQTNEGDYICGDCFESCYAQCEECCDVFSKEDGEFREPEEQVFWCLECIEKEEEREEDE